MDATERGSGGYCNGLGDPTTPGWASVDGCERLSEESVELRGDSPGIPSLPISAADGEVILKTVVGGVGPGPGILNLSYVVSFLCERKSQPLVDSLCVFLV